MSVGYKLTADDMNSFNKTEAAVFSFSLCFPRAFSFISLMLQTSYRVWSHQTTTRSWCGINYTLCFYWKSTTMYPMYLGVHMTRSGTAMFHFEGRWYHCHLADCSPTDMKTLPVRQLSFQCKSRHHLAGPASGCILKCDFFLLIAQTVYISNMNANPKFAIIKYTKVE